MNELNSYSKKVRTDITSPVFNDGMVVTAGDLTSAMQYPVELFQTLVRSYFGCGVVCGLAVEAYAAANAGAPGDNKWWLTMHPGTALDCNGHPLKVCECQKISLKPDPCSCDDLPDVVCIALHRCVVKEAPRDDGDPCGPGGATDAYRRLREYVEIKVFDPTDCDLPHLCKKDPNDVAGSTCECLKVCPERCCGESWVVLACVTLDPCDGITGVEDRRRWVKPIHCACLQGEPTSVDPAPPQLMISTAIAADAATKSRQKQTKKKSSTLPRSKTRQT